VHPAFDTPPLAMMNFASAANSPARIAVSALAALFLLG
jgi:hypothetical protein